MIYKFDNGGDNSVQVEYHRNKIELNYFVVYYKQRAVVCRDRITVKRAFGTAKFTPTVKAIGDWCDEMIEKYERAEKETKPVETNV